MEKNIMEKPNKISICIPTTELIYSDGTIMGVYMLNFLLKSISIQTFKDFEIIISDHSPSDIIEKECNNWPNLNIKYFKNTKGIGSAAMNLNFAISKATGEYIKTIFQDDYFHTKDALQYISDNLNDFKWGACGTMHCKEDNTNNLYRPMSPRWNNPVNVLSGSNSISGPSVLFFKNDKNYFDENLCWLNDVEFYYRLFIKYGTPLLLPNQCVVQRLRSQGVSNTLSNNIKREEKIFVLAKHGINKNSKNIKNYPAIYNRIKNIK
jgi:glycosyltransferase involved in cell wall biosynthesis